MPGYEAGVLVMNQTGAHSSAPSQGLPLVWLAWLAALLPFVTTHICYLLAASHGQVDWCIPYWDSCTSISATGRQLPAKYVFKLGMIPAALLTAALWWCLWGWGRQHQAGTGWWMPVLGSLAALALILYTLALGEVGQGYRTLRRPGVVLAFAFTFLAQVLFTRLLRRLAQRNGDPWWTHWWRRSLSLQLLLLGIGLLSVILDLVLGRGYDAMEDAFEWWMALLLNGYFVGVALLLRRDPGWLQIRAAGPGRV